VALRGMSGDLSAPRRTLAAGVLVAGAALLAGCQAEGGRVGVEAADAQGAASVLLEPEEPEAAEEPEVAELAEEGLPLDPDPAPASGKQRADGSSVGIEGSGDSVDDEPGVVAADAEGLSEDVASPEGSAEDEPEDEQVEFAFLLVLPQAPPAACRLYVPGERVTLTTEGFAADSTVTFSAEGVTAVGEALPAIQIPAATSDGEGRIEVGWVVPEAPAPEADAVPRAYGVAATGPAASGGTLRAVTPQPVVAYPGAAPCASDDAASTALGQAVRVAVLANDTAPFGGSLDTASVDYESVYHGTITVDSADGSMMYAPDPGFVGSETVRYWVHDNWGIGVSAEFTVTVDAGCTITGDPGAVDIEGTEGDDVICVPDPDDDLGFHVIDAKAGNDIILGGDGTDWIRGGPGDDVIYARGADDLIRGGPGIDNIYGGRGFDTITSPDLADVIIDEYGDDWFHGYELIVEAEPVPGPAAPAVSGDEAHASPAETLSIGVLDNDYDPDEDLNESTLKITRAPVTGTARVVDSADLGPHVRYTAAAATGSDAFTYEVCDLWDRCTAAEVSITVGAGGCSITGTDEDDVLYGTEGDDVICGLGGNDVINGGGGNDTLFGGHGNDTLSGGRGDDAIWGGSGDDTIDGNAGSDTLHGGSGDDTVGGGGGEDTIWGGTGNDTINGNAGDDAIWGGSGDDAINGGDGDDTIWGGTDADRLTGGTGADTLRAGWGDDALWGNSQNDILRGGPGNDVLRGDDHDDTLYGNTGDDQLYGNDGDDLGFGGWGDDTIDGGDGHDYLNGGDDTDICVEGEIKARCEA